MPKNDGYFSDPDANGGQPSGLHKHDGRWLANASLEFGHAAAGKAGDHREGPDLKPVKLNVPKKTSNK